MFFLSLKTSTVAFRTVLDELLCFFFALNLISFRYFFRNLSVRFCFLVCFSAKICPENSRELGRFPREFVSSNPAKFHFFSRELSEALFIVNTCTSSFCILFHMAFLDLCTLENIAQIKVELCSFFVDNRFV